MKPFNQQLEEYKNKSSGKGTLEEESFLFWRDNFVNIPGSFNPNDFLQGKVYSFEYTAELENTKKFTNKRPVIFFTGFNFPERKNIFSGIDLILMPPAVRIAFFNRITKVYESTIERNLEMQKKGEFRGQIPLKTDFVVLDTILAGIPFKKSFRTWDIKNVRGVKEISYEDWAKIIYLLTRSIQGTTIEEIYKKIQAD